MGIDAWLEDIGLPQHTAAFVRANVEVDSLGDLSDGWLKAMGIHPPAHRAQILEAVQQRAHVIHWPDGLAVEQLPTWLALPLQEYLKEANPRVKLHWLLDTVEVALRWAVAIALAEVRSDHDGALPASLQRAMREHIERPTVGRWVGMLRTLSAHAASNPLTDNIFGLSAAHIEPRFASEKHAAVTESILVLRNRVAHGGGLSTAHAADLLQTHESGFFALLRAVVATTAGVQIHGRSGQRVGTLVGLRPTVAIDAQSTLPSGVHLVRGKRSISLFPLVTWGPLQTLGGDGQFRQHGEALAVQIYARTTSKSLSYTPLGCAEAHAEADHLSDFRTLFGLEQRSSSKTPRQLAHDDALKEARKSAAGVMGRREDIRNVKAWIKDCMTHTAGTARIGWIGAGPGVGKSMLMSRVAADLGGGQFHGLFYHRFEVGDVSNSLRVFLRLFRDALWAWPSLQAATNPPDASVVELAALKEDVLERLAHLQSLPIDAARNKAPVFRVIVDGVDALMMTGIANEIRDLAVAGTVWVVAGRSDLTSSFQGPGFHAVFGDAGLPPMSGGDLRSMLIEGLGSARYALLGRDEDVDGEIHNRFVDRVVEQARGLPLYVDLLLDDLRSERLSIMDENRLPEGLSAYYQALTARMGVGDVQVDLTTLVCLLARSEAALGRGGIAHLLSLNDDPTHLDEVLLAGGALLKDVPLLSGRMGIALYHNGFRDYVGETPTLRRTRARAERMLMAAANDWQGLPPGDFQDHLFRWGNGYALAFGGVDGRVQVRARLMDFAYLIARLRALPAWEVRSLLAEYAKVLAAFGGEDKDPAFAHWHRFVAEHVHVLLRGNAAWSAEKILLQCAVEYADESAVTQAAEAWLQRQGGDWVWLRRADRRRQVPPSACRAVLEGHRQKVDGAHRLSDGRVLSWSMDHTLRLWNGRSGDALAVLRGHRDRVLGACVLDADTAVSWSADGTLRVWDMVDGLERRVLSAHTRPVEGMSVLTDGRLVSWSRDKTCRIWDVATGRSSAPLKGHRRIPKGVTPLPGGRFLSHDRTIRLWNPDTPAAPQAIWTDHTDQVAGITVLNDEQVLSWSADHSLRVWTVSTGTSQALIGHEGPVVGVLLLDGSHALSWSTDGTLRHWDLTTGAVLGVLAGHGGAVRDVTVLSDGHVVSCSADGTLRTWNVPNQQCIAVMDAVNGALVAVHALHDDRVVGHGQHGALAMWAPHSGQCLGSLRGHRHMVVGMSVCADDSILSWSQDGTLRRWSSDPRRLAAICAAEEQQQAVALHQGFVEGVQRLPDRRVLSWSKDGTMRLWSEGKAAIIDAHADGVRGVVVHSDGRQAVSWGGDHALKLWDLGTGALHGEMHGHQRTIQGVMFLDADMGGGALSWSSDASIRRWDLQRAMQTHAFDGHSKLIQGVKVLDDGTLLSWSSDGTLRTWSLDTGAPRLTFEGHSKLIQGVKVLDDGTLLSWSSDGTLRTWALDTGQCTAVFAGHDPKKAVKGVRVLDGGTLLSWSSDGTLRTWTLADATPQLIFSGHAGEVRQARVVGDGMLLSIGKDRTARLWDMLTGMQRDVVSVVEAPLLWPQQWRQCFAQGPMASVSEDAVAVGLSTGVGLLTPGGVAVWHGATTKWFADDVTATGELVVRDTGGPYFLHLYRGGERITVSQLVGAEEG